jgi:hypothetical protein
MESLFNILLMAGLIILLVFVGAIVVSKKNKSD